jgi:catechol 2,3-dioxygenase-like lactoylglutathione lyase family enzyme
MLLGGRSIIFVSCFIQNNSMSQSIEVRDSAVRYIVNDVDASVQFYVEKLGFTADIHVKHAFASLQLGKLRLFLNRPGAGGAGQAMPDGTVPEPGGWNRFQLQVADIGEVVDQLKHAGCTFRNEIITGVGGKQVLLEDPSGNFIELFEPAA